MKRYFPLVVLFLWGCFSSQDITGDIGDSHLYPDIVSDTDIVAYGPVIISVTPQIGYEDGGIEVTISGKYFQKDVKVFFGEAIAPVKMIGGTSVVVVESPPHPAGIVDVVVENPDGKRGVLRGGFEYKKREEPVSECVFKRCEVTPTLFKLDSSKVNTFISKVELAAQFTNWQENRLPMNDDGEYGDEIAGDGIYSRNVYLRSGAYEYKFILNDNEWISDPDNENVEPIFKNSVIKIDDGCTPKIVSQNIENGRLLTDSNVRFEVYYDLNGRALDKSAAYFIVDGNYRKAEFDEEDKKLYLNMYLPEGAHIYSVYIRDMECNSLTSPSTIFSINTAGKEPIANAGYTQITEPGRKVVLDGTLSEDLYQRGIDSFEWGVVEAGEAVVLADEYATDWAGYNFDPKAEPPKVRSYVSFTPTREGYYKFSLKVSNQNGDSKTDFTDVYVLPAPTSDLRPVANIDIEVQGENVSIDASASRSANSGSLNFLWIQDIRNPEGFIIDTDSSISIDIKKDGIYFLYLVVNDGFSNSEVKTIFIKKDRGVVIARDFSSAPQWFKGSNIYEIFVRRFMDSDGDGVGDLSGIKERLAYLKDLGVETLWLMPVFRSSDRDHGYHTIDYYTVEPEYGDNKVLLDLIKEAHKIGIRIILDMVINHTSRRHPFFKEALDMNPLFRNYYIWFENNSENLYDKYGYGREMGGTRLSLENGWAEIPDINYSNPVLRQYVYNMLKFWMDPNLDGDFSDGVDGFRIDHVTGPSHSIWMNLRRFVKSINPDAVLIAEIFRDFDNNNQGYGIKDYYNGEFDAAFTFPYYWNINSIVNGDSSPGSFDNLRYDLRAKFTKGVTHSFFIENHDIPYKSTALNEYGGNNEKGISQQISAASLMMMFPNTPQILYGEELGITEYRGFMPWESLGENNRLFTFYKKMYDLRREIDLNSDSRFLYVKNSSPDSVYSYAVITSSDKILGVINMKDSYVESVSINIGILREGMCGKLQLESVLEDEIKEVAENYHYLSIGPIRPYDVRVYKIREESSSEPVSVLFNVNISSKKFDIEKGKQVFISGDISQLGNWVAKSTIMNREGSENFNFSTKICNNTEVEYKYIIDYPAIERWDGVEFGGENRKVTISGDMKNEMEIQDIFGTH